MGFCEINLYLKEKNKLIYNKFRLHKSMSVSSRKKEFTFLIDNDTFNI